eukprot:CAMPEP_0117474826 /NCGR_PEP_ID=MMETSP0784-20121206/9481_1 /TAXON_ID=39447 /ORGANISM="" /LENGTH=401 /DNA_ID=CAMNT_0005269057 /DNA_START=51 /DNA_END=1252 /DNA_ORIENTATION=+
MGDGPTHAQAVWCSRGMALLSMLIFLYEWAGYNFIFLLGMLPALGKELFIPVFAVAFNVTWVMAFGVTSAPAVRTLASFRGAGRHSWRRRRASGCPQEKDGSLAMLRGVRLARPSARSAPTIARSASAASFEWTTTAPGRGIALASTTRNISSSLDSIRASAASSPSPLRCQSSSSARPDGLLLAAEQAAEAKRFTLAAGTPESIAFVGFGILGVAVFLFLLSMMCSHAPLAIRNLTSIEEIFDDEDNPYEYPDSCCNLAQIMGEFGVDWLFPVAPRRPLSDGVSFPTPYEILPPGLEPESDDESSSDNPAPEELWQYRYVAAASVAQPRLMPTGSSMGARLETTEVTSSHPSGLKAALKIEAAVGYFPLMGRSTEVRHRIGSRRTLHVGDRVSVCARLQG